MNRMLNTDGEEKSIGQLFSDLTTETTELVRNEVRLATIEITNKLSALQTGLVSLASGGVVALGGFLVLLAAAVLGLDRWLETPWLSALIVGAVTFVAGIGLVTAGGSMVKSEDLTPEKSPRSLRRDKELVQRHI